MTRHAKKLLDFSGLMEFRVGEYITVPSVNLTVKGTRNEVHGFAEA